MASFGGFDLGGMLKKAADDASRAVGGAAAAAADAASKFDAEKAIKDAGDAVSRFDAGKALQDAGNAVSEGVNAIAQAVVPVAKEGGNPGSPACHGFDVIDFASLLVCLASVDGEISDRERAKITGIAADLGAEMESEGCGFIDTVVDSMKPDADEFGALAATKINARFTIDNASMTERDRRLLCWGLLAVGRSDGVSADEMDFIRYVNERSGLDPVVADELIGYITAIGETSALAEELKASNRPYSEIEPLVAELAQREEAISAAAQALITDN